MLISLKSMKLNLMSDMCGAKKSPNGAIDGSRGIHPTGQGGGPHSSVAYATVGYDVLFSGEGYDISNFRNSFGE